MKQIIYRLVAITAMSVSLITTPITVNNQAERTIQNEKLMVTQVAEAHVGEVLASVSIANAVMTTAPVEPQYDFIYDITDEEIDLIALVTMAEAEGESEEGKRLVIDTILNRVESELRYFPDTVHDVIYQTNAFSSMWDGRADRCYVVESICELVREELVSRTNSEVMYFMAGKYSAYGTPMFQLGNHYFSGE